jgi:sialic acid synthase SpsE
MNNYVEFVAEIGSNWYVPGQDGLDRAKRLIESAARNGAHVAKFQMFKATELYRTTQKQTALKHLELPVSWLSELYRTCEGNGIEFACTPFYLDAVDYLVEYVDRWKIASWDCTYLPLLKKVAQFGMPTVLSTGGAEMEEVDTALEILSEITDLEEITVLHCTGGYPTEPRDMVLDRIVTLAAEFFPVQVGLSSHCTNPIITASSVLLGAKMIEVHYDLNDKAGAEAGHSYSPDGFAEMVRTAKLLLEAKTCNCEMTLTDTVARNMYYRDPSDWLRPLKVVK